MIVWAGIAAAFLIAWMFTVEHRFTQLEAICHGQCKYGDAECSKRCQKAGHCEFRMDE